MAREAKTTFTAIGFVVVAAVAGTCGYLFSQAQTSNTAATAYASGTTQSSAQTAATNIVSALSQANWSKEAFSQVETTQLGAWLSNPKNAATLQKGLKNIGTLKGDLTVAETRTESKNGYESAFVVLTGDFTKGKQFVNVAMTKQGNQWKVNQLSVVSQDRVFAERSYIVGAEILNQLSRTDWNTGTLNTFATPELQKAEHKAKVKDALSQLTQLGNVKRVNQMIRFHFDPKTQTADLLMDVEFTHTRRPVLMVMKLDHSKWQLDGISVMHYKEIKKGAHDATASATHTATHKPA